MDFDNTSPVQVENLVTVTDVSTLPIDLDFSVTSSNTDVVVAQVDTNGQLTLTFPAHAFGSADITVTARDIEGESDEQTFTVTVDSMNDLPTITAVDDQFVEEDQAIGPLAFTIGDVETTPAH